MLVRLQNSLLGEKQVRNVYQKTHGAVYGRTQCPVADVICPANQAHFTLNGNMARIHEY
jgi:hypothetical protein